MGNEILASAILNELGIITPETAMVFVDVNNVKSEMIFQEDSQKELLERNNRREDQSLRAMKALCGEEDVCLMKKKGLTL